MASQLERFFNPRSVAVCGATNNKGAVGYAIMKNMLYGGFEGIVYPVNPKRESVLAVRAYKSITAIPDTVDVVVIATPAPSVPGLVKEAGEKGVAAVVIISAGFKEVGPEGIAMCDDIMAMAKKYNMRILGPNCLGYIRPGLKMNASFATMTPKAGSVAVVSQSGALCTAILEWSTRANVGFSYFVSIGSAIDLTFHDLVDHIAKDPNTSCIICYMESLSDARKFLSAAREYTYGKPILVIKAGRSASGAKAAMSHTGSLAGNDRVYDAAFARAGILRVNTISELFNLSQTISMLKERVKGNRMVIVTNAGGPGVISTDALTSGPNAGHLAQLSEQTMAELNKVLPAQWSHGNPVDVLGDAGNDRYRKAVEICMKDKSVDGVLVILTPQEMTDATGVAKALVDIAHNANPEKKVIMASWMGITEGRDILLNGEVPAFDTPDEAINCFLAMYRDNATSEEIIATPEPEPEFTCDVAANEQIIKDAVAQGRMLLTEPEAKQFLKNYGLPVGNFRVCKTEEDAVAAFKEMNVPMVVMKIVSPQVIHKTDAGGVKLKISNEAEVRAAFKGIVESCQKHVPGCNIHGILMEPMNAKKYEVLIGCMKDPLFGPTVVFGSGGIAVELFNDTAIALPPINMAQARAVVNQTKVAKLLKGYRGMPGADLTQLASTLCKFGRLLSDFPAIGEIDINPFALDQTGAICLDARVLLDEAVIKAPVAPAPYSHLVLAPYPAKLVRKVEDVVIRPVRGDDEPAVLAYLQTLSVEEQQHVLFTKEAPCHRLLGHICQADYDRDILGVVEKAGKITGLVRVALVQWDLHRAVAGMKLSGLQCDAAVAAWAAEVAKFLGAQKLELAAPAIKGALDAVLF